MLLAHETRSARTDARLFAELETAGLVFTEVPRDALARDFRPAKVRVYSVEAGAHAR